MSKLESEQRMILTVIRRILHELAIHKDSSRQELDLKECRYVSELWVNLLFPVSKALLNNLKLNNNGLIIKLAKGNTQAQFDRTGTWDVIGMVSLPKKKTTMRDC